MENIVITPKDKKQLSVLKLILQEMKVNFFVQKKKDDTLYTKEEFYAKIEQSTKEAAEGKVYSVSNKKELQQFLDSL